MTPRQTDHPRIARERSDPPEVSPLVAQSRGTDGDRLLGPSRGVITGVLVVVTGSDGDEGDLSGRIDSVVGGSGLASSEGHRDDWKRPGLKVSGKCSWMKSLVLTLTGSLVSGLATSGEFSLGSLGPLFGVFSGPPAGAAMSAG